MTESSLVQANLAESSESWQPDEVAEVPRAEDLGTSLEDAGAAADRGYLDRPDRAFRLEHGDEYLEPLDQMSHPIEPFQDPQETVRLVNPDFETGEAHQVNCADAARCFERTWRGHAEEAAGRAYEIDRTGEHQGIRQPAGLYVEGEPSERTNEWAGGPLDQIHDPTSLRDALERSGHGSSAVVHTWARNEHGEGFAHAYNVVNHEGQVRVVDAQVRTVLPFSASNLYPGLGEAEGHRAVLWDAQGRRIHV